MSTKAFKGTLTFRSPINVDNGYTNRRIAKDVESIIDVEIGENGEGWYDWQIEQLDMGETGVLLFDGDMLTDYDGLFSLPKQLTDYLKENGYTMAEFIEEEED